MDLCEEICGRATLYIHLCSEYIQTYNQPDLGFKSIDRLEYSGTPEVEHTIDKYKKAKIKDKNQRQKPKTKTKGKS